MRDKPLFGPGGNGDWFAREGFSSSADAPAWVAGKGLGAYEYEAGRGLKSGEKTLRMIGEAAKLHHVRLSLHAPYFISLSSTEEQTRSKSVEWIIQSLEAAEWLGAEIIVVHSGSAGKISRQEGLELSCRTLAEVSSRCTGRQIKIGIETMGKRNQLGTVDEVIAQCLVDPELFVPVPDFGHINAREGGYFSGEDSYRRIFDVIGERLGDAVARNLHCHFSKIEYTGAGEVKHLTFSDQTFGPDPEPLLDAIRKDGLTPVIICESAGTQAEDALSMQQYYYR